MTCRPSAHTVKTAVLKPTTQIATSGPVAVIALAVGFPAITYGAPDRPDLCGSVEELEGLLAMQNGGSACVIHSLCCPVGGRAASPRKSQTKSQRRPTSGDAQRRQATVKPGQVPTERH